MASGSSTRDESGKSWDWNKGCVCDWVASGDLRCVDSGNKNRDCVCVCDWVASGSSMRAESLKSCDSDWVASGDLRRAESELA